MLFKDVEDFVFDIFLCNQMFLYDYSNKISEYDTTQLHIKYVPVIMVWFLGKQPPIFLNV